MHLRHIFRWVVAAAAAALTPFSQAQTPPVRIMPLGDSITDGSSFDSPDGSGGYRGPLYTALTAAGYNVDYIGTQTINSSLVPDQNHEGHSGWRIDQLDTPMAGWLGLLADPDVVLMHIGTNDFGQSFNTATAIDRLDALILKIATLRPWCHIIVTNLMERGEPANTSIQTLFNPLVAARVSAHATAGRRVTFLDMRAAVPLADMPDSLHPNQTGYDKMAAAWLPAIQAVITPLGDAQPPGIYRAIGNSNLSQVSVTFSKPLAESAATAGNFSISGGITVSAASLDATKRIVTLTTSPQMRGASYTITMNGIVDRTAGANALPANSTANFTGATQRGYLNNVPESNCYTLVQSLDVPATANFGASAVPYSIDNRAAIGPFSRVAYYIELQLDGGPLQYLWASMDAFTADVNKLGVPTTASGAVFQQGVTNLTVVSNVAGVTTGTGLAGNLEFWPTNYNATNGASVPGASSTLYDFGDTATPGTYGSMQLHNAAAAQTLFAYNNWGTTSTTAPATADIGIGNSTGANPDWTFANNGGAWAVKTIQVLVQSTGDVTGPALAAAQATFGRTKLTATFSEPLTAPSVSAANFSLSHGVTVLAASLSPNMRDVVLSTSPQPAATTLTLTVSGVRDTSPNANLIAAGSTIAVATAALPPEIVTNVGAAAVGYELVYSLDIPVTGNLNALGSAAYRVDDRNAPGTFTRVAYYMELQKPGGPVQYVWTSMDAFAAGRGAIGVPVQATGAIFQKNVTNMEVLSNVAGVVNGTTAAGGNIEFWPNSYSVANGAAVPNASATNYDTGDTRTTTAPAGYGCMQVHNHDAGANQTVFALNRFGVDGSVLDVGIGNNPSPVSNGVDWTFASNAGSYTRRVLHVLVLPGQTTDTALVAKVPEAANYQLVYSLNLPATGNLASGAGFTNYAVNNSLDIGQYSRIAYYMELQKTSDAAPRYVWTSMDAFTPLPGRIGVPTAASGAVFQQVVANMNVVSNVAGVVNGTGIATGNIEFWPTNYSQPNALSIPGASAATFDFGDTRSTTGSHGSMQVHNHGAAQTLFGVSNWGTAASTTNVLSMGIGNNPTAGQSPDYTQSANGASWDLRRVLQVYVLPVASDVTGPVITRAVGSTGLNRLVVTFDEPLAESAAAPGNFSIAGLTVSAATLLPGGREIALTTSAQSPATAYTVVASNVRDRAAGNPSLPGAAANFTSYSPPALLAGIPEAAGYDMIYRLAIPSAGPQWNLNAIPYGVDESKYGERLFDRVAYLMELDANWVWVSFDRHTNSLTKIGIPTLNVTATAFQQIVTNMNVASNAGGITTGSGITTGNIEFWGGNYNGANALGIPNANATTFDFGDTMTAGGYGSMQIHNHGAGQVLMAYNNWGSNTAASDTGIGNHPAPSATASGAQLDWTFSASAPASTVRNLYVFARPGGTSNGSAPVFFAHPCDRCVSAGSATIFVAQATGAVAWQWRKDGTPLAGRTNPWLEIPSVTAADLGTYDVIAYSSTLVPATSLPAVLTLNVAPIFAGYSFDAVMDQLAIVPFAQIIAHAFDANGDALNVISAGATSTAGGTQAVSAGNVLYSPPAGYTGPDSFTVTISDGRGGTVTGTIQVMVRQRGDPNANQASIALNGDGSVDVLFHGTPGQSYQIQRSTDLANWTVLTTLTATASGLLPWHDPTPPAGSGFYRPRAP